MKRKLFTSVLLVALFIAAGMQQSKAQTFDVGDKVINAGIGLGATYYSGTYYTAGFPPIIISGEYGFKDDIGPGVIGLGAYLGFDSYKWEYSYLTYDYGWKYTTVIIGARGTYHMEFIDDLDTYGGLLLGFQIVNDKPIGNYPVGIGYLEPDAAGAFVYSFFAGARYYFSDNFGVFGELGYGIAWLSLGAALKF